MGQSSLVRFSKANAMGLGNSHSLMVKSTPALGNTIQKVAMESTLILTRRPMMASGSTTKSMASALPNGLTETSMRAYT